MLSFIISRLVILIFGTLYPAYASYKAVKTKDIKEYVKWMMYWIVFAFFTAGEIFLDVFLSFWFPFYYELKIMFVIWLLCPATKGSNFMYRKFVHPLLSKREKDIDDYLERCKEDGYSAVLKLGSKAVTVATNTFIETAVRQIPLAQQWSALAALQAPPTQTDSSPSKRVRASDLYMPSREPIKRGLAASTPCYAASTPAKEFEPAEFMMSDDEADMPLSNRISRVDTVSGDDIDEYALAPPRKTNPTRPKRTRSKSRSRKTTVKAGK
uniref:Receptor expression-enhancing protein n=1 Tax=Cacopsylla melanoneura TaxID=428564 RepID=A0A8D9A8S1_9HEMI